MKKCSVNGKEMWLLTIQDLRKLTGVKAALLRKWEGLKILPRPAFVIPMSSPVFGECSRRLYLDEQAQILVWWLNLVKPGRGIKLKESHIRLLHEKWDEVTKKVLEQQKI